MILAEPHSARFAADYLVSMRIGTSLEDRPRYTPTTTFETFPFPEGLSPNVPAVQHVEQPRAVAIAEAARRLVTLRDRWLNPPEWAEWVEEPVSSFPKRPVARTEAAKKELRKRTLTNLYNARPQWLDDAHRVLDTAVAAAYGWSPDITEDESVTGTSHDELCDVRGVRDTANDATAHSERLKWTQTREHRERQELKCENRV